MTYSDVKTFVASWPRRLRPFLGRGSLSSRGTGDVGHGWTEVLTLHPLSDSDAGTGAV